MRSENEMLAGVKAGKDPQKGDYRRNQFGGSFGGPLMVDRVHFFFAIERTQQDTTQTVNTLGLFPALDGVYPTLYRDNQRLQMDLGAKGEKLKVIANGIEVERFNGLPRATCDMRPTMALIGRVVPIKDVKTFISAAADLRGRIPHLRALVLGPTDEDPAYFKECTELACELGLQETLIFTGNVNLVDYLPQIHVVVLTSLSEAQPLVLLEAGAAGIPCVTTDVGSCREILEGIGEQPALGPGGMVTHLVAPKQIADAVCGLLQDELLRRRLGHALCERVRRHYGSDRARREYSMLYRQFRTAPPRPPAARSG